MKDHTIIRIHSKGGRFTTRELQKIVKLAIFYAVKDFYLGARQELLFYVSDSKSSTFKNKLLEEGIEVEEDGLSQNITTSIPAVNVFTTKKWLNSGTYLDIIQSFRIHPKLSIGLVDPEQEIIPLMGNQLNFIASDDPDYWYLYLCLTPESKPFLWPVKIDTQSIYQVAKLIGGIYLGDKITDEEELVRYVNDDIKYQHLAFTKAPELPKHTMPSYDGMHNTGNVYWLGITRKRNMFPTAFLEQFAWLCQQQNIKNIYLTTWSSFIVRHIPKDGVKDWNHILGEYDVNTGHAYSELNWLVADIDDRARKLKAYVVSYFYTKNIRTEGLIFGIGSAKQDIFPSVLIKSIRILPFLNWFKYNVYHTDDFTTQSRTYILYTKGVSKIELPKTLAGVCSTFYKRQQSKIKAKKEETVVRGEAFYQCKDCLTVYDPKYGEEQQQVLPGTLFDSLPASFTCPLCGSPKEAFSLTTISSEIA
ncbi:MAG: rubredoxin [Cyclobacteriaceae bacterium]